MTRSKNRCAITRGSDGLRAADVAGGFTLIELVVTIAVAGILLAIAVPSYKTTIQNNRRSAAVNDFVSALSYARNAALSSRTSVTVCHSASPSSSSPTCSTTGGWQEGWVVFTDNDGSGTFDGSASPADVVLRTHEALPSGSTLSGQSALTISKSITFSSSGVTTQTGSLAYCDARTWGTNSRIVLVSGGGRVRSVNPADDSSISSCSPT